MALFVGLGPDCHWLQWSGDWPPGAALVIQCFGLQTEQQKELSIELVPLSATDILTPALRSSLRTLSPATMLATHAVRSAIAILLLAILPTLGSYSYRQGGSSSNGGGGEVRYIKKSSSSSGSQSYPANTVFMQQQQRTRPGGVQYIRQTSSSGGSQRIPGKTYYIQGGTQRLPGKTYYIQVGGRY
ncbi:hypothetical protein J6590_036501 [Homalodisca vitripennis]|nr:hypothetical protein J6590_036501 [Homalodisca vitripennis]